MLSNSAVYNFSVGDEFHYKKGTWIRSTYLASNYIDIVTAKIESGNSLVYSIHRVSNRIESTFNFTIDTIDLSNSVVNLQALDEKYVYTTTQEIGYGGLTISKLSYHENIPDYNEPTYYTEKYGEGIGKVYSSESWIYGQKTEELVYTTKKAA